MIKKSFLLFGVISTIISCSGSEEQKQLTQKYAIEEQVDLFLETYNTKYQDLLYQSAEASWTLNTKIVQGDSITSKIAEEKEEEFAAFTGSKENIENAQKFLAQKSMLSDLQIKQLETILYFAASNPETILEVVKKTIKANTNQVKTLFGHSFVYKGKDISTNFIDSVLRSSKNLDERLSIWKASKEVGKDLKSGLVDLRSLRNQCVQPLGYKNYFDYQVSDYGLKSAEMISINRKIIQDIWPLYRELHTWARYELAKQYEVSVPDLLPAHWLPNRWGQDWTSMVEVKGINIDDKLSQKGPKWIVEQAEQFYVSLGFPALPESFYEKSSLYPLADSVDYKKNNHASAWHMNNAEDVRSLMSVEPNTEWWETTLHELGHIYYYMTYSNENVPIILRGGANRAYHEAIGSLLGLASLQKPFLQSYGLISNNVQVNDTLLLLKEALNYVVLIPWASGVMTEFEYALYDQNIPPDAFNKTWWKLKKKYQGIEPNEERSELYCDAATKTHINNDPAQYYDYALSYVLLFQFHQHIANTILNQDPHRTNYYGNKKVGDFLKELMKPGATVDWRENLKNNIGTQMSAEPMLSYFEPLMDYLKLKNKGRRYTLPEKI